MTKVFSKLLFLSIFAVFISACTQTPTAIPESTPTETEISAETNDEMVEMFEFVADEEDTNALQATQKRATVELKEYDFGVMVESIDGQKANSEYYWSLYVNDAYGTAGASETTLVPGDKVTWKYEAIQQGL